MSFSNYIYKRGDFKERATETKGITMNSKKKTKKGWWRCLHNVDLNRHWRGLGAPVTRPEGDAGTPVAGWGRAGVVVWNVSQHLLAWWWCQFPVSGESIYRQGCDFRVSQPQHLAFSSIRHQAHSNASLWLIFRVDSLGRSFPIPFLS